MNTNQVNSAVNAYTTTDVYKKNTEAKANTTGKSNQTVVQNNPKNDADTAYVYEKNANGGASAAKRNNYITLTKENQDVIAQLKADAEQRTSQLRSLVESMILKQNQTFNIGTLTDEKMYEMLRKGEVEVSPEVRAQAQKDIAEDGYWGVEQTSERLFSFAKAISGGDIKMADKLISAMEKGFKQATKAWGDDFPEICQKTLDAAKEKIQNWAKGTDSAEDETAKAAADAFLNQAATEAQTTKE